MEKCKFGRGLASSLRLTPPEKFEGRIGVFSFDAASSLPVVMPSPNICNNGLSQTPKPRIFDGVLGDVDGGVEKFPQPKSSGQMNFSRFEQHVLF